MDEKSQLFNLLSSIGHEAKDITDYQSYEDFKIHSCDLTLKLPNGLEIHGYGKGASKKKAEIEASSDVINQLHEDYPHLIVDWDKINVDAQAGDALIKLGVYLSGNLKVSDNSSRLQSIETNERLAKVFDRWIADKDPDLAGLGTHMDIHKKASVVEALLWRRFNKKVIAEGANEHLKTLLKSIDF
jgi:hypothetical protein